MLNLLLALLVGLVVVTLVKLAGFSLVAGVIPGVIALVAAYVFLARRIMMKVQALAAQVQKELSTPSMNVRERQRKVESAVKTLEQGLRYERWQFLVGSEVHGQIGMLKYMTRDLGGAEPHLAKANSRNYMAFALRGALAYQKKDFSKMRECFGTAVKAGRKEPLIWAAYAWCLMQMKEKSEALQVMAKAVEANPNEERLKSGLTALQNDKKLRMRAYEPMWWQFGLEQPPTELSGGRQVRFQRR